MARYFIDNKKFDELKAFEVKPGDLIISCSVVNLGKLAEIPKGALPGIINQALLKITLDSLKMDTTFFKVLFSTERMQENILGLRRGSGVPNFPPMSTVKQIQFLCPPIKLQRKFCDCFDEIKNQQINSDNLLFKNNNLFNSLLQRAFKGELKFNDSAFPDR